MDSEGISDGLSAERKVEIRVRKSGIKDKVIVEKSAAQGLPQGWIKKLVTSNRRGRKVRRDPFFIDPKSGYIFRSFKDASRYVETGDIGHYARKLEESNFQDDDSGIGKTLAPLEKLSQDDLLEKEKEIDICNRRNLSSFDQQHFENCELKEEAKDPIVKRVTRSQAKASKEEVPKSKQETVKIRMSSASSQITRGKAKVKKNEVSNSVGRRASKRLAGIELEPTPELKSRTKAQRVVPGECNQPAGVNQEVAASDNEHSCESMGMEVEIVRADGRNGCGTKCEKRAAGKGLGPCDCDNGNARINRVAPKSEMVEKNANSLSPPLADLWKDPCIAFAIKTLTGESLCLPDSGAVSDPKQNEMPGTEKPIWEDPCIDFAIKTLTGAIPVGLEEADGGFKASRGSEKEAYCDQECKMKM